MPGADNKATTMSLTTHPSPHPLGERRLDNGIVVTITDHSRRLAGDRWHLRLEFRIRLNDETARQCLARLRPQHTKTASLPAWEQLIVRERHFVDEQAVDELRQAILDEFERSLIPYLASSRAPERLVARRLRDWRPGPPAGTTSRYADLDADSGPADFSFLFRDQGDKT